MGGRATDEDSVEPTDNAGGASPAGGSADTVNKLVLIALIVTVAALGFVLFRVFDDAAADLAAADPSTEAEGSEATSRAEERVAALSRTLAQTQERLEAAEARLEDEDRDIADETADRLRQELRDAIADHDDTLTELREARAEIRDLERELDEARDALEGPNRDASGASDSDD